VAAGSSAAADSPDAGERQPAFKALPPEEIAALTAGHGMGLAMAAERNSYPGPRHVLDLGEALGLTPAQRDGAAALLAAVRREAPALGRAIVADEQALEALFASGTAELGTVETLVAQIAARRGALRFVHLAAHVKMRALLTPRQIARYDELRGHGSGYRQDHSE
jgi:Spy/CpxP family protein refolding chaperone